MDWYEPGEDTYTLMDVISSEQIAGKVLIDMGCSTGIITGMLDANNLVISVDLNEKALRTMKGKNCVCSDLLLGINQSKIDICIFNPPYVPDFDCKILGGGKNGREVIDRFIDSVEIKTVYLLVIEANKPIEVKERLEQRGYDVQVMTIRRIIGETIIIFKANLIN